MAQIKIISAGALTFVSVIVVSYLVLSGGGLFGGGQSEGLPSVGVIIDEGESGQTTPSDEASLAAEGGETSGEETVSDDTQETTGNAATNHLGQIPNEDSRFGFMPANPDYDAAKLAGGNWDRPFFELFGWQSVQPAEGAPYDFKTPDAYVLEAQAKGFNALANLEPFAAWDQAKCHSDLQKVSAPMMAPGKEGGQGGGAQFMTRGKPCDMGAYEDYVKAVVERYDGDGVDDMPGLRYPIRYWEVANEPEMQKAPLVFFQGSADNYFEILKAAYLAVKEADPGAKVLNGGMAGMESWMQDFWKEILAKGGGSYFDIANIHSIDHGEDLNMPAFREFMSRNGVEKPIWITEVQYGYDSAKNQNPSANDFARLLVRSYAYAFGEGADKLFYVNLRKMPSSPSKEEGGPGFLDGSELVGADGTKLLIFYAHRALAGKIDKFTSVEKLRQGKYKFIVAGKPVYVLWGVGKAPVEITGRVKVTRLDDTVEEMDASELKLSVYSPIIVEIA